ncbi:MAG TPA: hypothetical protein VK730_13550 [Solirubrobacteraceae bacterium]|jgi:hypothetical protein|nr:hypothetical protein [Solirubrobacteraceae bacterium]
MIEDPEIVKLILQGRVTQLRRPAPPRGKRHSLKPGRVHPIHRAHGEKAATRIIIRTVRPERLGAAGPEDARREGCRTIAELFERWRAKYGTLDLDADVLVISFIKGEREKERYLRATPPRFDPTAENRPETDEDRGYTTNPSRGIPGRSVDDATLARFAREAAVKRRAHAAAEQLDRSHMSPAERLRLVNEESKRLGIDISSETRMIGQRVGRAEHAVDTADGLPSGTHV